MVISVEPRSRKNCLNKYKNKFTRIYLDKDKDKKIHFHPDQNIPIT